MGLFDARPRRQHGEGVSLEVDVAIVEGDGCQPGGLSGFDGIDRLSQRDDPAPGGQHVQVSRECRWIDAVAAAQPVVHHDQRTSRT
jgi:hypothetical protein